MLASVLQFGHGPCDHSQEIRDHGKHRESSNRNHACARTCRNHLQDQPILEDQVCDRGAQDEDGREGDTPHSNDAIWLWQFKELCDLKPGKVVYREERSKRLRPNTGVSMFIQLRLRNRSWHRVLTSRAAGKFSKVILM